MKKRSEAVATDVYNPSSGTFVPKEAEPPPVEEPPKVAGPTLTNDFERVVQNIFVHDVWLTYQRLEKELEQGDGRTDHGSLVKALDRAETNARTAHKLSMSANIEVARFEAEMDTVRASMRAAAVAALEREQAKRITNDDVEARIAAIYPDETKYHRERGAKVKAMKASMENLASLWVSRCFSLRTLVDKSR